MSQIINDDKLIELFFARSEDAIQQLSLKYGGNMYAVSYNVLRDREDAEECVNDAYLGVWNAIPPARPTGLCSFVCRITRNIALSIRRRKLAQKRNGVGVLCLDEIAECIPDRFTVTDEIEQKELSEILNRWLGTLDKTNLYIFLRRYWYMEQASDIASVLGMSEGAVYLRIDRMKKKLCKYLEKNGIII